MLNWNRAKIKRGWDPETSEQVALRKAANLLLAGVKKKRRYPPRSLRSLQHSPRFPAVVTVPDGDGIAVLTFRSRAEADAAGFSWVGR